MIALSSSSLSAPMLDETVILDADRGAYYRLNSVASRVWDLLASGPRSVEAVVETVVAEYEVDPARAEADVVALLQRFADHDLVDLQHPSN
ncbi:MAG: PqqD family protein [Actinomycetota bacterium]|nr:PqqD family protein [Actinomycetota bacterium]